MRYETPLIQNSPRISGRLRVVAEEVQYAFQSEIALNSLARELLCPFLIEIGTIARSRIAGISIRYAEIRRRRKRANLNHETANEFSRRAANRGS